MRPANPTDPDPSPVSAGRRRGVRGDSHATHAARHDLGASSPGAPRPRRGARARLVAGRVAIHAGGHLPHGDALAALGRAAVALGGPWLAAAWTIGALAGSRAPRGARRRGGARAGHRGLVPAHGGRGRPRGHGLRGARRRRVGRRRARPRARSSAWRARAGATAPPRVRAAAIAALAGALAGEALLLAGQWAGRAAAVVLAAELAVGLGLLAAARRRAPLVLTLRSSRSPRWPSRASRTACATRCAWPAGPGP